MSAKKKDVQKVGVIVTGLTIFAGTVAHAKKTKKWEDIHTLLSLIGVGITAYGAFA